jgi:hypothetical protein
MGRDADGWTDVLLKKKKKKKPQCNSRIQPLGKGGREGSK